MTSTDTSKPTSPNDSSRPRTSSQTSSQTQHIISPAEIQQCKMVGDINLFLPDGVDGDGECEIMIASEYKVQQSISLSPIPTSLAHIPTYLPHLPSRPLPCIPCNSQKNHPCTEPSLHRVISTIHSSPEHVLTLPTNQPKRCICPRRCSLDPGYLADECRSARSEERICQRGFVDVVSLSPSVHVHSYIAPPHLPTLPATRGWWRVNSLNPPLTHPSLTYTTTHLPFDPTHLIARIGSSNTPSTTLFKRLGFGVVKVVEVFDQVEMRWQGGQHPGEDVSGEGVSGEDMLGESLATRAASGGLWGVDLSDRVGPYDR